VGVACFAGGDDHHAVVGFVFEVEEPQQGDCQLRAVGCGAAEKLCSASVVIAPVPGAEPDTADAVGGGDAGEDGESSGDVEVLVAVAFVEDEGCDLQGRRGRSAVGSGPRLPRIVLCDGGMARDVPSVGLPGMSRLRPGWRRGRSR
jgi:hypothetical protein